MATQNHTYRRAFTVLELLLGLAITAMLLAAVAVALNASAVNYATNDDIFKAVNNARQALFRITAQLRTATAVDPNSPANTCSLITADGRDITYYYNSTDDKLYLVTNDDATDPDYILCDHVTAMSFTKDTATADGLTFVKSVRISMTVLVGRAERTLCAAAVVRRNLQQ